MSIGQAKYGFWSHVVQAANITRGESCFHILSWRLRKCVLVKHENIVHYSIQFNSIYFIHGSLYMIWDKSNNYKAFDKKKFRPMDLHGNLNSPFLILQQFPKHVMCNWTSVWMNIRFKCYLPMSLQACPHNITSQSVPSSRANPSVRSWN
jgi:hypothetical protein